jgi:hypothetical protein
MQFVEGEMLEGLIKRSGRLEIKLALEIGDPGSRWFGCGTQTEAGSPGYQTKQHHGDPGGGRRCDRENH